MDAQSCWCFLLCRHNNYYMVLTRIFEHNVHSLHDDTLKKLIQLYCGKTKETEGTHMHTRMRGVGKTGRLVEKRKREKNGVDVFAGEDQ